MATECEFDPDHLYHDHREADELRAEIERLQRENGSLARFYAQSEELLRERTGRLNAAEAKLERLRDENATLRGERDGWKQGSELHELARNALHAENERLRAALEELLSDHPAECACPYCSVTNP